MEKKTFERKPSSTQPAGQSDNAGRSEKPARRGKKLTEYGRQLKEKQKVKELYGMRERQFRRFLG